MPDQLPAGPYRHVTLADGTDVPYYIIPFDKKGRCEGPKTRQHLIDYAKEYTDIYLFSHGWNNDWKTATDRYESFIQGFVKMRKDNSLAMPPGYKPLLVGVFWPSAILVKESEEGPQFAAGDPAIMDAEIGAAQQALHDLASELPNDKVERFYELAQKDGFSEAEALEFARILQPIYTSGNDEVTGAAARSPEEIVASWKQLAPQADAAVPNLDDFGVTGQSSGAVAAPAGIIDFMRDLPRNALRGVTVWQMKDRAGTVGANGVSPLLVDLLKSTNAHVNVIGHSYGGKVVLSALCVPDRLPRKAHSVLLLQPAVSHLCFAEQLPITGKRGGYHEAFERVERPILSTFSKRDIPLTQVFHLALIRPSDLGEMKIAAEGEPPSIFAALGGFGPRRCGEKLIDMQDVNQPYALDSAVRIYGLRGDRTIAGHGDISNPSTWWALYNLAKA
ncbi:MAG: hypothetical protein WCA10_24715 [Terracidiphilus sp.]